MIMNCKYDDAHCDVWTPELIAKGDAEEFVYELCPKCPRNKALVIKD